MQYFSRCLREVSMQAYSQDLRERVLRALDRGDRPTEIARRFEVSRVWVYQVRDREQETGVRSSFQIGGHRRSRLAEREQMLRAWIAAEPDLTLAELQQRLEHFHKSYSVFGAKKIAFAIGGGNGLEGRFRGSKQGAFRARSLAAQELLDLAPHVFDGVEVGGIGRQIEESSACGFQGLADSPDFVGRQIVHNH